MTCRFAAGKNRATRNLPNLEQTLSLGSPLNISSLSETSLSLKNYDIVNCVAMAMNALAAEVLEVVNFCFAKLQLAGSWFHE